MRTMYETFIKAMESDKGAGETSSSLCRSETLDFRVSIENMR